MNSPINYKMLVRWIVPAGIYEFLKTKLSYKLSKEEKVILQKNRSFRDKHIGERCFILATGPSIKGQDLTILRNEICFGVSDFYKHEDYHAVRPLYYCLAPLHPPFEKKDGLRRFDELSQNHHGGETFFIGLSDKDIFYDSQLANQADKTYFISLIKTQDLPGQVNLAQHLPSMSSVTIMAVCVAIYMGFSEIYLLGCDHNNIWTWDGNSNQNQLEHFYNGSPSIGYQHHVFDIDRALRAHLRVREQYRWVKNLAIQKNIKIINATPGSYIDIFPRADITEIIDLKQD